MLREAIAAAVPLEAIFAIESALGHVPPEGSADVYVVPEAALRRISDVQTPSGIVAVAPLRFATLDGLLEGPGPLLYLAGIADPGNAGTLLRSAEAFGAAGVIFGDGAVEPYHPKVVRASMGSIFRVALCVSTGADLIARAKARSWAVIATAVDGSPVEAFAFPAKGVYAIGNERHGTAGALPGSDATISITHAGPAESLNAAVAGSIVLYEATRAQRRP